MSQEPGTSTGNDDVDAAVAALGDLDQVPVTGHAARFEEAHDRLRAVLTEAGEDTPAARP